MACFENSCCQKSEFGWFWAIQYLPKGLLSKSAGFVYKSSQRIPTCSSRREDHTCQSIQELAWRCHRPKGYRAEKFSKISEGFLDCQPLTVNAVTFIPSVVLPGAGSYLWNDRPRLSAFARCTGASICDILSAQIAECRVAPIAKIGPHAVSGPGAFGQHLTSALAAGILF